MQSVRGDIGLDEITEVDGMTLEVFIGEDLGINYCGMGNDQILAGTTIVCLLAFISVRIWSKSFQLVVICG